ncbi:hypothetical protein [Helicobacter cinaedi]|nr:hypothetical protein [Helicobacter cinaedi]
MRIVLGRKYTTLSIALPLLAPVLVARSVSSFEGVNTALQIFTPF